MPNMSYCRFQNTAADLADCMEALDDGVLNETDEDEKLSESEERAARRLVRMCKEISENYGQEV